MSIVIVPQDRLDMAAIALHRVLEQSNFDHAFFGGYQLLLMGSTRGTKNVDVVVKKPMFNGFEKVKQAFVDDREFMVIDGNRTDAIRAIHSPSNTGIDIVLQDLPKRKIILPESEDPNQLPLYPTTHMFIKNIECLSIRRKESDEEDLVFLFDKYEAELDQRKISKKVPASQRDEALDKHPDHPRVAEILASLNLK